MTQKERLIKLMIEAKRTEPEIGSFTEYLADCLLENGAIVPPAKVGDAVYCIEFEEGIDEGRVYAVSQNEKTLWVSARYESGLRYDHPAHVIGETVFLSRKEAEKALEKRSEGDA